MLLVSPFHAGAAPPVPPEPGAVETIAGPGFCERPARVRPDSVTVRALAVDGEGNTFVDTGISLEGVIAKVNRLGQATILRTGSSRASIGRIASDGAGGVFVAAGTRIEHVGPEGPLGRVAGDPKVPVEGPPGSTSGDGGPAEAAAFSRILSISSDAFANLYVAEEVDPNSGTFRIRFINRGSAPATFYPATAGEVTIQPGHIDLIAGVPGHANSKDATLARKATFLGGAPAMAWGPGRLYVSVFWRDKSGTHSRIRMINLEGSSVRAHAVDVTPGTVEWIGGRGRAGHSMDGGRALHAALSRVPGMSTDSGGNLLLADESNHRIRRIDNRGVISTVAGSQSASGGFNGNGRKARGALLNRPHDVKVGPGQRVYISDKMNGQLRFVGRGGTIEAAAGNNLTLAWNCFPGERHVSNRVPEAVPASVAGDPNGNVFFSFNNRAQVFRADRSGKVGPVVGSLRPPANCTQLADCPNGDGGRPSGALLASPSGLAVRPGGGLYILEETTGRVRLANLTKKRLMVHGVAVRPNTIETVIGGPSRKVKRSDEKPQVALSGSGSLAADGRGNLFVADPGSQRVLQVNRQGRISTLTYVNDSSLDLGCCTQPTGIALDGAGNVYVADRAQARVWFINRGSKPLSIYGTTIRARTIQPIAGTGKEGFAGDGGPAIQAQLLGPVSLALDRRRNLYVLDYGEHTIRRIDASGTIDTFAGTGTPGFNGDGLKARLSAFRYPAEIAMDACNRLLVADMANQRVRRIALDDRCRP